MATSVPPYRFTNGFKEPNKVIPWAVKDIHDEEEYEKPHYVIPPSIELETAVGGNSMGVSVLRTWPTIYDGTNSPHALPSWWKPQEDVDVLICGAGPAGLQTALSLARQGVSFRIIDKSDAPLLSGRADGVQPRFLETLRSWGLATEVHEEGPLMAHTALYKDGKKLVFRQAHQCDSHYRGVQVITQGQLERVYIRDLLRHKTIVERSTEIADFNVSSNGSESHPVRITLKNNVSGREENIRSKFLVGTDGASSSIRKKLNVPFDGVSTDIYWGILDCKFETDWPHMGVFGLCISSKYGGCVIIPREYGYVRIYTQIDISATGDLAKDRKENVGIEGGRIDTSSITPDEVLVQTNRIFAPYTVKFAAPISWFAIWKISERVARTFTTDDCRVFLAGDAAHIHSTMGAFGLTGSMLDAANLAWKIGLCARDLAKLSVLGPSYDSERRFHANRIIIISGSYLRFVCQSTISLADVKHFNSDWPPMDEPISYVKGNDMEFLGKFFATNTEFLLGVNAQYPRSAVSPEARDRTVGPRNGVRAPNPRVCLSASQAGYLYDTMIGASVIHILIFASDMQGHVQKQLANLAGDLSRPQGFFRKFGGRSRFNLVLITKCLPHEAPSLLGTEGLETLNDLCTVVFDDRAPDEDAHTCYEIDHAQGAVVVVRPDLWIGNSVRLSQVSELEFYFGNWLLPAKNESNGDHI